MNLSVVIPVYRGEETLGPLVERLGKVLPTIANSFEVLLINDDSPDRSWTVIETLSQAYPWVRGIDLMRNYGQENATLCGIREACYEIIVTMDDDLQHFPEDIPNLVAKLSEGFDVAFGVPRSRSQAWWKGILSAWVKRVIALILGSKSVRDISAFKAMRAELRDAFASVHSPDVQLDALLSWATTKFVSVPIDEGPRTVGRSNYNLYKLIKVSILILTSYTTIPLRFASVLGFFFTILGFFVFIYVVTIYFTAGSIPGFPFLVSIVTIFSGVQLFALGIIGEYLALSFERSSGRPPYVIKKKTEIGA